MCIIPLIGLGKTLSPVLDADAARNRWVFRPALLLPPLKQDTVSISEEARRRFIESLSKPRR